MSADKKLVCQLIVTLAVVLPFWGFVFCLFFYAREIDSSARDTVTQITGGLIAAFAGSIGFWLGTSASSAAKDATISTLTGATK